MDNLASPTGSGLTSAQDAYFNYLTSPSGGNRSAADAMKYVSGLNDYQALASLSVQQGKPQYISSNPTFTPEDVSTQMGLLQSQYGMPITNYADPTANNSNGSAGGGALPTSSGMISNAINNQGEAPQSAAMPSPQNSALQSATVQQNTPSTGFGNPFQYDQQNPYLNGMADSIKNQVNDNLSRNILPNIAGGAQMVGGFGGSRQGVVEANALKDANQQLSNSLSNLYYGDYNNAMSRQLQKYSSDQGYDISQGNLALGNKNSDQNYNLGVGNLGLGLYNAANNYNLGLGSLALGNKNADNSFYTAQRGLDLNATQLGANLFNMGNQGYMGQGTGVYNLGLTQQQAPWQTVNNMNAAVTPYTGYGSTSMTQGTNQAANIAGGALMGSQLYKNLGLSGGSTSGSGNDYTVIGGGLGLQAPNTGFWKTN